MVCAFGYDKSGVLVGGPVGSWRYRSGVRRVEAGGLDYIVLRARVSSIVTVCYVDSGTSLRGDCFGTLGEEVTVQWLRGLGGVGLERSVGSALALEASCST